MKLLAVKPRLSRSYSAARITSAYLTLLITTRGGYFNRTPASRRDLVQLCLNDIDNVLAMLH